MRLAAALAAALALACAGRERAAAAAPPRGLEAEDARAVVTRLAGSLADGRFEEAHRLLSARWRAAYTPSRLAADWRGAGPSGREAAERAASVAAGTPVAIEGARATLPLGNGRAAVLVAEDGGWRVDALE